MLKSPCQGAFFLQKGYLCKLMKTRTLKKDKVNIITLGCSKNMVRQRSAEWPACRQ